MLQFIDFLKKNRFSVQVSGAQDKIISALRSGLFMENVEPYFCQMHAVGVPFTQFEKEPSTIIQFKNTINALYEIKTVLIEIESGQWLYNSISLNKRLYRACMLLTHLDFNLSPIFSEELSALVFLVTNVLSGVEGCAQGTKVVLSNIDTYKIGRKCGIAVDQLHPKDGQVDYEFLTTLSGYLPSYLKILTGYIKEFSATVSDYEPRIDKLQLDKLQDHALQLLNALQITRKTHLFLPIEALGYIRVIRHTIVLSMSIYEQAGYLTESSQTTLCDKISEIKYKLIPQLFGFIDKIEVAAMLKPGLISIPLGDEVTGFYQTLISYCEKFVNFDQKAPHLRSLVDARFIDERLNLSFQRRAQEHSALLSLNIAQTAVTEFFRILEDQREIHTERSKKLWFYQRAPTLDIVNCPMATKTQLSTLYKIIQPYVLQLNIPLNKALENPAYIGLEQSTLASLVKPVGAGFGGLVTQIQRFQPVLEHHLAQLKNTHQFQIAVTDCLIDFVSRDASCLKPFSQGLAGNPYIINEIALELVMENQRLMNEKKPLTEAQIALIATNKVTIERLKDVDDRTIDLQALTKEKIVMFYNAYQKKQNQLKRAYKAYLTFYEMLVVNGAPLLLDDFNASDKKILAQLYFVFQSYVVNKVILSPLDESIVQVLTSANRADLPIAEIVLHNDSIKHLCFVPECLKIGARTRAFSRLVRNIMQRESLLKPLVQDAGYEARAMHLIKHQKYSAFILTLKGDLEKLLAIFNDNIQDVLKGKAAYGLPFPELTDLNQTLAESSQTVSLKQLFNCLYHLEQAIYHLEQLREDMYSVTFYKVIYDLWPHLQGMVTTIQSLARSESVSIFSSEMTEKMRDCYRMLMELRRHYMPGAVDHSQGHYPVLFHSLNALEIIPEHIGSLRVNNPLLQKEIDVMHAHSSDISANIEKIFAHADSYVRLFVKLPTMARLFKELKAKMSKMSRESHDVVTDNLAEINNSYLARILIEADTWEMRFGLKPGIMSATIKTRLDAFYQGLLEPLGLPSPRHMSLVRSERPILNRIEAMQGQIDFETEGRYYALCKKQEFERLLLSMKQCQPAIPATKEPMLSLFHLLLPNIQHDLAFLASQLPAVSASAIKTDQILNESVGVDSKLVNMEGLVNAGIHYFEGLRASHQLKIDAGVKKMEFLEALRLEQLKLTEVYAEKYTRDHFNKQFIALTTKQIGFIHCSREYNDKLKIYLSGKMEAIVLLAKKAENIEEKTAELIYQNVKLFEEDHYRNYRHLEDILTAINRLKLYLSQSNVGIEWGSSVFESQHTYTNKAKLASELEEIALDKTRPISQRLSELKTNIESDLSKTILFACHPHDKFSLAALTQWFLSFLDLIGLYVPERKKCYNQLLASATPPTTTSIAKLSAQHGLFAQNSRHRAYSLPDVERQSTLLVA